MIRYLLAIFVILTLASAGFWYLRYETTQSGVPLNEMREHLTGFLPKGIDNVTLSDDEVRRRYYAAMHLIDPKMSLPGTDLSVMRDTLTVMASSTSISRDVYATWIDPEVLYPLEMLKYFADTEDARRQMRNDPTSDAVRIYHEELMSLFSRYEEALEKIEHFLAENEAFGSARFWQGTTRSDYVGKQIAKIRESISAEKQLEENRYSCVKTSRYHACPSLQALMVAKQKDTSPSLTTERKIDPKTSNRARFFEDQIRLVRHQEPTPLITTSGQPIVLLENSRCAPNDSPQFVSIYAINTRVSDLRGLRLFGLDDIYLFDVWKEQETGFLPPEPKVPEIYRYTLQPDNYYTCIDYGYDAHTALSIAYIRENLKVALPGATKADDETRLIESAALSLKEATVPSDIRAAHFIALIDSALLTHGPAWLEEHFGKEVSDQLLNYRDVWHAKSGFFELALGTIDDFMVRTLYARPDGTPTIDAPWFFLSHSNIVSFYQLANATVVRDTPSLLKNQNTLAIPFPETFPGIWSYENELKKTIPTHQQLQISTREADAYIRNYLFQGE